MHGFTLNEEYRPLKLGYGQHKIYLEQNIIPVIFHLSLHGKRNMLLTPEGIPAVAGTNPAPVTGVDYRVNALRYLSRLAQFTWDDVYHPCKSLQKERILRFFDDTLAFLSY